MPVEALVRGASLAIAGLFFVAAAHKAHAIRRGSASAEPLVRVTPLRRRHARQLVAAAGIVEVAVGGLLLFYPLAGFLSAGVLVLAYAVELRRLPANEPCNCFGALVLGRSRSGAIGRNIALAVLSAGGLAAYTADAVETDRISEGALGIGLILAALIAAQAAISRVGTTAGVMRELGHDSQENVGGSA